MLEKNVISLVATILLHGTTTSIALLGLTVNPVSSVLYLSAIPANPVYESTSAIFSVLLCIRVHFTRFPKYQWETEDRKEEEKERSTSASLLS